MRKTQQVKKVKEEHYSITPKGIMSRYVDIETVESILNDLELYIRRFYCKEKGDVPSLVFDNGEVKFTVVRRTTK